MKTTICPPGTDDLANALERQIVPEKPDTVLDNSWNSICPHHQGVRSARLLMGIDAALNRGRAPGEKHDGLAQYAIGENDLHACRLIIFFSIPR
jgi:hypothetical protein